MSDCDELARQIAAMRTELRELRRLLTVQGVIERAERPPPARPNVQRHSQPSDFLHRPDGTVVPLRAQRQP